MSGPEDCVFCAIVRGDVPAEVVRSDERAIAFLDINPSSRGHVLVVPRAHSTDIQDAPADDLAACLATAQAVARRQLAELGADGINLLHSTGRAAGQTVFHFHVHVVPRYSGDGIADPLPHRAADPDELRATAAALREG